MLKNFIFSTVTRDDDVADEALDDIDERWTDIVNQLGNASFSDFVRHHHNSAHPRVSKRELFSAVRRLVAEPKIAYEYLSSLDEVAPIYAALLSPDDDWWPRQSKGAYRDVQKPLRGLRLFLVRQPLPIFLAAFLRFSPEEFTKLVGYVYSLSMRYNVICHHSPSEQENIYNHIAIKINDGNFKRASHVKNCSPFKRLYPNDEEFIRSFELLRMPSRHSSKKIRFLLGEIEAQMGMTTEPSETVLEHVCPYHPTTEWQDYFGEGAHDVQDSIGNMILLERDELKRGSFEDKRAEYQRSGRPLAKKVAAYPQWDLPTLQAHQRWLAQRAVETWRLDFV